MQPDDTVCFCFHVSLRKIETFCNVEKPQAASQISECLSAGTGCGWCVPMIRKVHLRICGEYIPWWRKEEALARDIPEEIDSEAYKAGRKQYIAEGQGQPPAGAGE